MADGDKDRGNIGILILGVSVILLVVAFSTALIIGANNFSKRLDTSSETIHKLEQIVVSQQCQLSITGDYYEGVAEAFGAPPVAAGEPNPARQAGIDKIIAAGKRAAEESTCKPKE